MDHVSTWLQASALPPRIEVCGTVCPPLSVWHVHVLTQVGNAYILAKPADRDAAAELIYYASAGRAKGASLFWRPLERRRRLRRIARRLQRIKDWPSADLAVCDYVGLCMRTPGHKSPAVKQGEPSTSRAVAAPLPWVLVSFLSRGNPGAIEAAWDTPYAVARCLFDAARDADGDDDSLETSEEEIRYDQWQASHN